MIVKLNPVAPQAHGIRATVRVWAQSAEWVSILAHAHAVQPCRGHAQWRSPALAGTQCAAERVAASHPRLQRLSLPAAATATATGTFLTCSVLCYQVFCCLQEVFPPFFVIYLRYVKKYTQSFMGATGRHVEKELASTRSLLDQSRLTSTHSQREVYRVCRVLKPHRFHSSLSHL